MQINNLKVENFKSLVKVNATGFGAVNFIHGFNNSGKSNFLKFLELLFSHKTVTFTTKYIDEFNIERERKSIGENTPFWRGYIYDMPFIFTNNKRQKNILFEVQLELNNNEYPHFRELIDAGYLYKNRVSTPIKITGEIASINQNDSQMILKEVELKGLSIFSTTDGAPKIFKTPAGSALANNEGLFNDVMDVFNNCVFLIESERYFNKEKLLQESPEIFTTGNFKNWLYGLSLDADRFDKFSSLITFLDKFNLTSKVEKVLDKNLVNYPFTKTKMTFSKFKEEIEVMLENPIGRFPLKNFGTGVQQLFYILSRIFDTPSNIILIEELELNLSPEYQELIINNLQKFLEDKKISQVFFTSHSDYLNRNDFKVYEVSIDENGKSDIKGSTYNGLKAMRRKFLTFAETGKKE
jgi:AAA15 family ATPase/GTPase